VEERGSEPARGDDGYIIIVTTSTSFYRFSAASTAVRTQIRWILTLNPTAAFDGQFLAA